MFFKESADPRFHHFRMESPSVRTGGNRKDYYIEVLLATVDKWNFNTRYRRITTRTLPDKRNKGYIEIIGKPINFVKAWERKERKKNEIYIYIEKEIIRKLIRLKLVTISRDKNREREREITNKHTMMLLIYFER